MRIKKSGGNLPWCSKEELDKLFLFEAEFSLMFVKANAGAEDKYYFATEINNFLNEGEFRGKKTNLMMISF